MPTYEADHRTTIAATAEEAFAVLTDFTHLPDWQDSVKRCTILGTGADGLPDLVRYEADVRVRRITYTLRHTYDRPTRIFSEYVEGDFKRFEGDWAIDPEGPDRISARTWLRIDPGIPVPGPVFRMLHRHVLRGAVEDLRKRLEGR